MLVTAYYDIYGKPARFWEYFDLFYDMAASGLPIVLFTDPTLLRKFRFLPPTVHVVAVPLESFELYRMAMAYKGELPTHRDPAKDTQAFFGLMATKAEFVKRAKELFPNERQYLWQDYGVRKILKDHEVSIVIEKLKQIEEHGNYTRGCFPGCWADSRGFSVESVNWRFCGGFYILPASFVDRFFDHNRAVLRDFTTNPLYKLTWETNCYTCVSLFAEDRHMLQVYLADHNSSMWENAPLSN